MPSRASTKAGAPSSKRASTDAVLRGAQRAVAQEAGARELAAARATEELERRVVVVEVRERPARVGRAIHDRGVAVAAEQRGGRGVPGSGGAPRAEGQQDAAPSAHEGVERLARLAGRPRRVVQHHDAGFGQVLRPQGASGPRCRMSKRGRSPIASARLQEQALRAAAAVAPHDSTTRSWPGASTNRNTSSCGSASRSSRTRACCGLRGERDGIERHGGHAPLGQLDGPAPHQVPSELQAHGDRAARALPLPRDPRGDGHALAAALVDALQCDLGDAPVVRLRLGEVDEAQLGARRELDLVEAVERAALEVAHQHQLAPRPPRLVEQPQPQLERGGEARPAPAELGAVEGRLRRPPDRRSASQRPRRCSPKKTRPVRSPAPASPRTRARRLERARPALPVTHRVRAVDEDHARCRAACRRLRPGGAVEHRLGERQRQQHEPGAAQRQQQPLADAPATHRAVRDRASGT